MMFPRTTTIYMFDEVNIRCKNRKVISNKFDVWAMFNILYHRMVYVCVCVYMYYMCVSVLYNLFL